MNCKGLDEQVARSNKQIADMLQKFVRVRVVQMDGIDLEQFQIDRDLSFAAFFLNADGTVYGRFGSRGENDGSIRNTVPALGKAMERALAVHAEYPKNKDALQSKKGGPSPWGWKTPEDMPSIGQRFKNSCIHCHHVGGGELNSLAMQKKGIPDRLVWPYPVPETVGIDMVMDDGLLVKDVKAGSIADKAGIKPGDLFETAEGQPLVSMADLQFVLHNAPDEGEVAAQVRRGSDLVPVALKLAGKWRKWDTTWRRSGAAQYARQAEARK